MRQSQLPRLSSRLSYAPVSLALALVIRPTGRLILSNTNCGESDYTKQSKNFCGHNDHRTQTTDYSHTFPAEPFARIVWTIVRGGFRMIIMTTKIFALLCVIGFAAVCIAQDQSPSPGESPAQEPTKRAHKKAETTARPAETAASPSAAASPALLPKRSALTDQPRLQQQQVQPRHLQLPPRENTPKQRPALQQWQVLRHPRHQLNSTSAICSNRGRRRLQPVPRPRAQPQRKARALRQRRKRLRLAEATARFGLTPRHTFITRKARVSRHHKKGKYMTEAEAIKEGNKAGAERH